MSGFTIGPGNFGGIDFNPPPPVETDPAAGGDGQSLQSPLLAGSAALQEGAAADSIRFGAQGDGVRTLQTALAQLGFQPGAADGVFGRGTQSALAQFQRQQGLTPDGVFGPQSLAALDSALSTAGAGAAGGAGATSAVGGTTSAQGPNGQSMVNGALSIIAKHGQNYGVDAPWYNIDSNHALPVGQNLGGLAGTWKCNLFAGNTMAAAGFQPPYYGNQGHGEYPNANQLYKWSDKYAAQFGNQGHVAFALEGEIDPRTASPDQIQSLLTKAQPGDMVIVQHPGGQVADGGHCRVVVSNDMANGGTIQCAQASFDSALVKNEPVGDFTGEDHIWILRPNSPRPGGPAPV